jgi:hypothetical protein
MSPPQPPPATTVNTSLKVWVTNWFQDQSTIAVRYQNQPLMLTSPGHYGFSSGNSTTDEYATVISILDPAGFLIPKVFPVTSATTNYVDAMAYVNLTILNVLIRTAGTYPLPGGGNLILPDSAFGLPTSGALNTFMNAGYLHPADSNYAAMLPCYPFADDQGRRWFLNSYGVCYFESTTDFSPVRDSITLQLPIVTSQQATAPDSVPVWNLNSNNRWQKYGYAHKSGNTYSAHIGHVGFWNFAAEETGGYRTIHLKTTSGAPVVNTRIVIKDGYGEVADGRTDLNGYLQLFIPVDEPLSLGLVADLYNNWARIDQSHLPISFPTNSSTMEFTVPDRQDLVMINGKAFNCDGSPIVSGTAVFNDVYSWDSYAFPIRNGSFTIGEWIDYANNLGTITILDASGKPLDTTSLALGSNFVFGAKTYDVNLYSCVNSTQLYCNYTLDGTRYSITGTTSSTEPVLTEGDSGVVTMTSNGKGISFQGWINQILGNYFDRLGIYGAPNGVQVNGIYYPYGQTLDLEISRADANVGGFVEGWFYITYIDGQNVTHTVSGNFRVKKV